MVDEGYAAVTTRRVAAEAGLKAPLIHYYFPTTDDLFVAVYCRAAEQVFLRLDTALATEQPLRALWEFVSDPSRTTLAVELMALANHRKIIRRELAAYTDLLKSYFEAHPPATIKEAQKIQDGADANQ